MDITGEFRIPATRERVWEGLNDPDVLKECIPGCESIERESDTELTSRMRVKVGPVKANFSTRIELSDLNPPVGYTITGEGKGGPAGFGKGGAEVTLDEDGDETVLRYSARLQVGGKLAQVGSRLLGGTARKLAEQFFSRFCALMAGGSGAGAA